MTELETLTDDLFDEQEALDEVVAGLSTDDWKRPSPSPGWTVADQIGHLTYFDGTAALAIESTDAFRKSVDDLLLDEDGIEEAALFRRLEPDALLERWRENRRALLDWASTLADTDRVPWYGPDMSAKSFVTARLMECWAHGTDVVDAVGAELPSTRRLAHIARLGFITRGWSYINRGEQVPDGEVRVELDGPEGDRWEFGPEDAAASVSGDAEQFCLVVTQRRNLDDTSLTVDGALADDWLRKAQAFAGPPTDGPAKGERP